MNLNKKGITLVEIIISVSLISIVLVFLFNMLIQVNNENSDNEIKSSYLVNQSTFIKQIEEDFLDNNLYLGEECVASDVSTTNTSAGIYLSSGRIYDDNIILDKNNINMNMKCLKFSLGVYPNLTNSYLFIYKRKNADSETGYVTILSYYRGDFKQSVELEDFDWLENKEYNVYAKSTSTGADKYQLFSLPIIGPDGNDYSINLSYIG